MQIREYLKTRKLLTDGAFGTYFQAKYNEVVLPELANIQAPDFVRQVHEEYVEAGARLLRTNTFASNTRQMQASLEQVKENILAGCRIATEVAEKWNAIHADDPVFVIGDIGPIPEVIETAGIGKEHEIQQEYVTILRTFAEAGIENIVFETCADVDHVLPAIEEFKGKNGNATSTNELNGMFPEAVSNAAESIFVMVQICVNQHGYTNKGLSARKLLGDLANSSAVDGIGFNCGIGPGSMKSVMDHVDLLKYAGEMGKVISVLPNASFPTRVGGQTVFEGNDQYFASKMTEIANRGTNIIGGCCGTTPQFIRRMKEEIDLQQGELLYNVTSTDSAAKIRKKDSSFYAGKTAGEKLVAVELSPPFGADDEKLMDSANFLTDLPVDCITLPDSPSGRTRADSILMGVKVQGETKIAAVPHICCRDRNVIALRSSLLGAYMNGIRNLLVITGDPVPTVMRQDIKSVFNFDSIGLMRIIQELNEEQFAEDPITYGGAINHNRLNMEFEVQRMERKMDVGATFFLTQPAFSDKDVEKLQVFSVHMKNKNPEAKLFCGLMPLVSKKNALFIQNELMGIDVTDEIVARYVEGMSKAEGEAVGISIVNEVIAHTKDFVDGYYFSLPFNRTYLLKGILPNVKCYQR